MYELYAFKYNWSRGEQKWNDFSRKNKKKEAISIRISTNLLATVDQKSAAFDISRNEFINQCILFALKHMDEG